MTRIAFVLLLLVAGCTTGGAGSSAGESGIVAGAAELGFEVETDAAAQEVVTFEAGGAVAATAADGTTFELVVPPHAVAGDTEIKVTPLSDVEGIGDGSAYAVQLEPEGLELFELARLTITPAAPIAFEDQLMFEASGDGSGAGLAMLDPSSEPIVLLLDHFSIGGVASATAQQRATFIEKSAANAERRINNAIREQWGWNGTSSSQREPRPRRLTSRS